MLNFKNYVLGILLIFMVSSSFAEPYPKHIYNGLKNSFDDPTWLAYAGGIYLLHFFDEPVRETFTGKLLPAPVSKVADYYGQGINFGISSGYVFGDGFYNDLTGKDIRTNLQYHAEAFVINGLLTVGLKELVRRQRPDDSNHRSFPSGHTSTSFVVAASMQQIYGNKVGIPFYTMAVITGIQRIHAQKHWFTDVLSGALFGMLIGNGFGELLKNDSPSSPPMLSVTLTF